MLLLQDEIANTLVTTRRESSLFNKNGFGVHIDELEPTWIWNSPVQVQNRCLYCKMTNQTHQKLNLHLLLNLQEQNLLKALSLFISGVILAYLSEEYN